MGGGGVQTRVPLIAMMIFSICCIVFTALVKASTVSEDVGSSTINGLNNTAGNVTSTGAGTKCDGMFSCIGMVFGFLWDAVTFNIDGAPFWVRVPIVTFYGTTIIMGVISILQGLWI